MGKKRVKFAFDERSYDAEQFAEAVRADAEGRPIAEPAYGPVTVNRLLDTIDALRLRIAELETVQASECVTDEDS